MLVGKCASGTGLVLRLIDMCSRLLSKNQFLRYMCVCVCLRKQGVACTCVFNGGVLVWFGCGFFILGPFDGGMPVLLLLLHAFSASRLRVVLGCICEGGD